MKVPRFCQHHTSRCLRRPPRHRRDLICRRVSRGFGRSAAGWRSSSRPSTAACGSSTSSRRRSPARWPACSGSSSQRRADEKATGSPWMRRLSASGSASSPTDEKPAGGCSSDGRVHGLVLHQRRCGASPTFRLALHLNHHPRCLEMDVEGIEPSSDSSFIRADQLACRRAVTRICRQANSPDQASCLSPTALRLTQLLTRPVPVVGFASPGPWTAPPLRRAQN